MKTLKTFLAEVQTIKVPKFKTEKDMQKFIHSLPGAAKVADYVVNPDTGEVIMEPGEQKKKVFKREAPNLRKWGNFEDVYRIKYAMLSKITGMSTQELADADIEDTKVPEFIQRVDGYKIDADDIDEIEWGIEDMLPSNVSYSTADNKGKRAYINYELG